MKWIRALLLLPLYAWGVTDPTLPLVYVNTTFPTFSGVTIAVHKGDDLQAAIDSAACGGRLVLDAGIRWVGNYMLRHRANCMMYTGIVSSGLSSLPVGTRVSPADVSHMATISTATVAPVIDDANNANYWWIAGMHITTENAVILADGVNQQFGFLFGYQHNGNETPANSATHIVLDRVVIDGNPTCECKRGMMWNGAHQALIDSYVEVHSAIFENQAIGGVRGTGPFKIVNNELRGSGENILFGGGDPSDRTTVAADFEIKRNLFYKPSTWQAAGYLVKNLLELKSAKRLLIDGNIFDGSWISGQDGVAISFKAANQNDGVGCPQCTTQDVTFTNNIVRNANMGFVFYGQEVGGDSAAHTPPESPVLAARIKVSNVLLSLKGLPATYLFAFGANDQGHKLGFHSPSDVQIDHVTAIGYTNIMASPEVTGADFLVRNSVLERGGVGFGQGGNEGSNCYGRLQCVLGYWLTPYTFDHMLILNNAGTDPMGLAALYSTVAPLFAVGYGDFVDYANRATDYHNLALTAMSAGHLAASDGKDLGVDFVALDAAINGTVVLTNSGGTNSGGLFTDQETPIGTIDGINRVFTLLNAPDPPKSLLLYRNGLFQTMCITTKQSEAGRCDYFLLGKTITFTKRLSTGTILTASYRR